MEAIPRGPRASRNCPVLEIIRKNTCLQAGSESEDIFLVLLIEPVKYPRGCFKRKLEILLLLG